MEYQNEIKASATGLSSPVTLDTYDQGKTLQYSTYDPVTGVGVSGTVGDTAQAEKNNARDQRYISECIADSANIQARIDATPDKKHAGDQALLERNNNLIAEYTGSINTRNKVVADFPNIQKQWDDSHAAPQVPIVPITAANNISTATDQTSNTTAGTATKNADGTTSTPMPTDAVAKLSDTNAVVYVAPDPSTKSNPVELKPAEATPIVTEDVASTPINNKTKIGSTDSNLLDLSNVTTNVLHDYASYTYGLTLAAMTKDEYNTFVDSPTGDYTLNNVMIASAGKWWGDTKESARSPWFNEDFFFEKLEFETVIGGDPRARNTNVLTVNFSIIEPYGVTFLNRLMAMSDEINDNVTGNKSTDNPYMLQIDFYGYSDQNFSDPGAPKQGVPELIPGISKNIIIQLLSIKFKVNTKGAEYEIAAVPYSHQAYSESVGNTPIRLEVSAKDLQEFFLTKSGAPAYEPLAVEKLTIKNKVVNDAQTRTITTLQIQDNNRAKLTDPEAIKRNLAERAVMEKQLKSGPGGEDSAKAISEHNSTDTSVNSYTGAVNSWWRSTYPKEKQKYADIIRFVFSPPANSETSTNAEALSQLTEAFKQLTVAKFPNNELVNKSSRAFDKIDTTKPIESQSGLKPNMNDEKNPRLQMTIAQNMPITDVINLAVINSSYIYEQIIDYTLDKLTVDELEKKMSKPLNWFKISPSIKLGDIDPALNRRQKIITYSISPSLVYNSKSIDAPMGAPTMVFKDYQYIFTGQNKDILNFDLNFDTQFFVITQPTIKQQEQANASPTMTPAKDKSTETATLTRDEAIELINKKNKSRPELKAKQQPAAGSPGQTLNQDSKSAASKQLQKNIFGEAGNTGDQLQVNLKIIGDPDFIKQDDVIYGPADVNPDNPLLTPNGSIRTDNAEIHVRLSFKSPSDYNTRGLAIPGNDGNASNFNETYNSSVFSGVYRVITVKNIFSGGKFEQELTLVRIANQPVDGLPSKAVSSTEPTINDDKTVNSDATTIPNTATSVNMDVPTSMPTSTTLGLPPVTTANILGNNSLTNNAIQNPVNVDLTCKLGTPSLTNSALASATTPAIVITGETKSITAPANADATANTAVPIATPTPPPPADQAPTPPAKTQRQQQEEFYATVNDLQKQIDAKDAIAADLVKQQQASFNDAESYEFTLGPRNSWTADQAAKLKQMYNTANGYAPQIDAIKAELISIANSVPTPPVGAGASIRYMPHGQYSTPQITPN
jgi:hypothetical protein